MMRHPRMILLTIALNSFRVSSWVGKQNVNLLYSCRSRLPVGERSLQNTHNQLFSTGLSSEKPTVLQRNLNAPRKAVNDAVPTTSSSAPPVSIEEDKTVAKTAGGIVGQNYDQDDDIMSYKGNDECSIDAAQLDEDVSILVEEMAESIDLSRENARMDSLNSYIVVSVLTATASFSTVETLELNETTWDIIFVHYGAIVFAVLSALSGIYSTVVFSLCSAYGRASLGLRRDVKYDKFMKDSSMLRLKGFQAYMISLGLFLVEMVLVSCERMDPEIRYPTLFGCSVLAAYIFKDWGELVDIARPIFAGVPSSDDMPDMIDQQE